MLTSRPTSIQSSSSRLVPLILVVGLTLATFADNAVAHETIRSEPLKPQSFRLSVTELPPPFHTESASKSPKVVPAPADPVLNVPEGFRVDVFSENLERPRWLAITPTGQVLCALSKRNQIVLLEDADGDGDAEVILEFLSEAQGANQPFGMAFADGAFYLANTDGILRFEYQPGQKEIRTPGRKIAELPGLGYNQHWTRNVMVSPDGKKLFVTVGSQENVAEEPAPRSCVLTMNLDGSDVKVLGSGIRNPVGLDFHPKSGECYVTVNERDGIGDGLVPDYLTRVQEGQFYGFPYTYMAPHLLDPRMVKDGVSLNPERAAKTATPDVLFEAHSAALGLAFTRGEMFPEPYRNGAFVAFRGSWNRNQATGYKLVFVPFGDDNRPTGGYDDFLTGFLLDPEIPQTWARPVGVVFAKDGSLLFTDDGNGRIYRVSYDHGK